MLTFNDVVKVENQQEESVYITAWYRDGRTQIYVQPITVGYDPDNQCFYEEASTLQFHNWPIKVMFRTNTDEYLFQLANPVYKKDELIFVGYKSPNSNVKLLVYND